MYKRERPNAVGCVAGLALLLIMIGILALLAVYAWLLIGG